MQLTFEQMPAALQQIQKSIDLLNEKIDRLEASQPVNEPPITGEVLRKRLQISRPTEIDMRKRGKLPYLIVNGQYRYHWPTVFNAISKNNR